MKDDKGLGLGQEFTLVKRRCPDDRVNEFIDALVSSGELAATTKKLINDNADIDDVLRMVIDVYREWAVAEMGR